MNSEYEYTITAMGTEWFISIVTTSKTVADEAYAMAHQDITEFERRFSRFLPSSELSQLNTKKEMRVSDMFLEVTRSARKLFEQTRGIFNPLVQISRFGYDKDFTAMRDNENTDTREPYDIDFSTVVIDEQRKTVTLQEGQKLDFGGFLKGYLAQRIANAIVLRFPGINGLIINLGGDICARGLDADGKEFVFSIYNPVLEHAEIQIPLFNQSLATSGTYKRTWNQQGKPVHHILDASGDRNPESNIVSASIIHPDGAHSEAYTKVLLALGADAAQKLLNEPIHFVAIQRNGETLSNIL